MEDQQQQDIYNMLSDKNQYKQESKQYLEKIKQQDFDTMLLLINTCNDAITQENTTPMQKLQAVRFIREGSTIGNQDYIACIEQIIMDQFEQLANRQNVDMIFNYDPSSSTSGNLKSIAHTFHYMILECIMMWAFYYPQSFQTQSESKFVNVYKNLLQKGQVFNQNLKFFTTENDKLIYEQNKNKYDQYKQSNSQLQKQPQQQQIKQKQQKLELPNLNSPQFNQELQNFLVILEDKKTEFYELIYKTQNEKQLNQQQFNYYNDYFKQVGEYFETLLQEEEAMQNIDENSIDIIFDSQSLILDFEKFIKNYQDKHDNYINFRQNILSLNADDNTTPGQPDQKYNEEQEQIRKQEEAIHKQQQLLEQQKIEEEQKQKEIQQQKQKQMEQQRQKQEQLEKEKQQQEEQRQLRLQHLEQQEKQKQIEQEKQKQLKIQQELEEQEKLQKQQEEKEEKERQLIQQQEQEAQRLILQEQKRLEELQKKQKEQEEKQKQLKLKIEQQEQEELMIKRQQQAQQQILQSQQQKASQQAQLQTQINKQFQQGSNYFVEQEKYDPYEHERQIQQIKSQNNNQSSRNDQNTQQQNHNEVNDALSDKQPRQPLLTTLQSQNLESQQNLNTQTQLNINQNPNSSHQIRLSQQQQYFNLNKVENFEQNQQQQEHNRHQSSHISNHAGQLPIPIKLNTMHRNSPSNNFTPQKLENESVLHQSKQQSQVFQNQNQYDQESEQQVSSRYESNKQSQHEQNKNLISQQKYQELFEKYQNSTKETEFYKQKIIQQEQQITEQNTRINKLKDDIINMEQEKKDFLEIQMQAEKGINYEEGLQHSQGANLGEIGKKIILQENQNLKNSLQDSMKAIRQKDSQIQYLNIQLQDKSFLLQSQSKQSGSQREQDFVEVINKKEKEIETFTKERTVLTESIKQYQKRFQDQAKVIQELRFYEQEHNKLTQNLYQTKQQLMEKQILIDKLNEQQNNNQNLNLENSHNNFKLTPQGEKLKQIEEDQEESKFESQYKQNLQNSPLQKELQQLQQNTKNNKILLSQQQDILRSSSREHLQNNYNNIELNGQKNLSKTVNIVPLKTDDNYQQDQSQFNQRKPLEQSMNLQRSKNLSKSKKPQKIFEPIYQRNVEEMNQVYNILNIKQKDQEKEQQERQNRFNQNLENKIKSDKTQKVIKGFEIQYNNKYFDYLEPCINLTDFKKSCLKQNSILFINDHIQIVQLSEIQYIQEKAYLNIQLCYQNLTGYDLQNFFVSFDQGMQNSLKLWVKPQQMPQVLKKRDQFTQEFIIDFTSIPFHTLHGYMIYKWQEVQQKVQISLPNVINKYFQNQEISQQDFKRNWSILNHTVFKSQIINVNPSLARTYHDIIKYFFPGFIEISTKNNDFGGFTYRLGGWVSIKNCKSNLLIRLTWIKNSEIVIQVLNKDNKLDQLQENVIEQVIQTFIMIFDQNALQY